MDIVISTTNSLHKGCLQFRLNKLLALLGFLLLLSCSEKPKAEYSGLTKHSTSNFNKLYPQYCQIDGNNPELDAVLSSFVGDHQSSIRLATERVQKRFSDNIAFENKEALAMVKLHHQKMINDPSVTDEEKETATKFLNILNRSANLEELFSEWHLQDAREYITERAADFHFTLINEAHYSSINRAFTTQLLKTLWDKGYRYLALETLDYRDSTLSERGYPIISSGPYIKESTFGNLVREALEIGYQLITYETRNSHDGTLRDRDQAQNIVQKTWERDKAGKVLVHVGYSHLSESGDSAYRPMGGQLKKLINQDILTVEQENMLPLLQEEKMHPYSVFVKNNYELKQPIVFVNDNQESLVDPIIASGIDIQVYHPAPTFSNDRPDWLQNNEYQFHELPDEVYEYKEHLLQVMKEGEDDSAVPVDQFVIGNNSGPIVKWGSYHLRIISCEGNLVASLQLSISE